MNEYSKQALLDRLAKGSVMNGWGSILAMGRGPLNQMLREQFLEALGEQRFMQSYTGQVAIDVGGTVTAGFNGLVLGPPQVSFEKAGLSNAQVTVRMNLIAGEYDHHYALAGTPPLLKQSVGISEAMGFVLQAQVPLTGDDGPTGKRGVIRLDLANAHDFTCNLGDTDYAKSIIGRHLGEWVRQQDSERNRYNLGSFDFTDYNPLSPKRLYLLTQPAPWAATPPEAGEGALVVFMQLNTDLQPGTLPLPGSDFPYLVPRDEAIECTLLSGQTTMQSACGAMMDILAPQAMTNGRKVALLDSQAPRDQVVFGTLAAGPATVEVLPGFASVKAGNNQPFAIIGGAQTDQWTASNLIRPLASGKVAENGTYAARPTSDFIQQTQVSVVTSHQGETTRSALVVESLSAVQASPRVMTWGVGQPPVELSAASTDGGELQWALVGGALGELVALPGGRARFTPKAPEDYVPEILMQVIRVTDQKTQASTEVCVVIIAWAQALTVQPHHVLRQDSFTPVDFTLAPRTAEQEDAAKVDALTWSVFGEGQVDGNGRYTPPLHPTLPCSVVMADRNEELSGYAIIEHGRRQAPMSSVASWTGLDVFTVKEMGAAHCFANGLQQVRVRVTITTKPLDNGLHPTISDGELATLKFSMVGGGYLQEVPFGEEGIEPPVNDEDHGTWVMNPRRNRFALAAGAAGQAEVLDNPGERIKDYYLQTTSQGTERFFAVFQSEDGAWMRSIDDKPEAGTVELQGVIVPAFARESYLFERERVAQDGQVIDNDQFNYMHRSTDYWRLPAVVREGRTIPFVMLRIDAAQNKSTVRWESEQYEETFCSYTGFAFGGAAGLDTLTFDGLLCTLMTRRAARLDPALIKGKQPAAGELVVSLHRVSDLKYWDDVREQLPLRTSLDRPMRFELVDREGNRHKLQLAYQGAPQNPLMDGRNTLTLSLQPRS